MVDVAWNLKATVEKLLIGEIDGRVHRQHVCLCLLKYLTSSGTMDILTVFAILVLLLVEELVIRGVWRGAGVEMVDIIVTV